MRSKKVCALAVACSMLVPATACGKNASVSNASSMGTSLVSGGSETVVSKIDEPDEKRTLTTTELKEQLASRVEINDYISLDTVEPLVWKVADEVSGKEMYIMGTIHALPQGVDIVSDGLEKIYEECDCIATEADFGEVGYTSDYYEALKYDDGTKAGDHLTEQTYNSIKNYVQQYGRYTGGANDFHVGYWIVWAGQIMSITNVSGLDRTGVEGVFTNMARDDGKEIISIEMPEEHADALMGYSDELAEYTIKEMFEEQDDPNYQAKEYAKQFETWASGNEEKLEAFVDSEYGPEVYPEELVDDLKEFRRIVLSERNIKMADKAVEIMNNGKKCLFMVGAAHFAGEDGVDDLLRAKGYKVERVDLP